jgi:hypothetical protein
MITWNWIFFYASDDEQNTAQDLSSRMQRVTPGSKIRFGSALQRHVVTTYFHRPPPA